MWLPPLPPKDGCSSPWIVAWVTSAPTRRAVAGIVVLRLIDQSAPAVDDAITELANWAGLHGSASGSAAWPAEAAARAARRAALKT
jgi:hypothetical protein